MVCVCECRFSGRRATSSLRRITRRRRSQRPECPFLRGRERPKRSTSGASTRYFLPCSHIPLYALILFALGLILLVLWDNTFNLVHVVFSLKYEYSFNLYICTIYNHNNHFRLWSSLTENRWTWFWMTEAISPPMFIQSFRNILKVCFVILHLYSSPRF